MARRPRTDQHAVKADGIVNAITGLGVLGKDQRTRSYFGTPTILDPAQLEGIFRGNGIGRRIVDLPVSEMTREWFEVKGDSEGACLGYLESLHAKASVQDALTWADLYGGSLIVMGLDDGQKDLSIELALPRLRKVAFFHVYDRWQVTWMTGDLYTEPTHPLFNQPMRYRVTPYGGGQPFTVHESRTLTFKGAKVPPRAERENQGWGDSMLQAPFEQLRNSCALDDVVSLLAEASDIGVLKIKNLVQLLAMKDGESKVKQRLEIIDYAKHVLKTMLLADGEEYERKATQALTGLAQIQDRQAQRVSAATGIPVTLLFGEVPSGLQATGKINQSNWYDDVHGRQERKLLPPLERLVRYVYLSSEGPTRGKEPPNWKIEFCPLWQPTENEQAELRKTQADVDVAYINAGVLDPAEVAISRFGGERYSTDTKLEPSLRTERQPMPVAKPNGAAQRV